MNQKLNFVSIEKDYGYRHVSTVVDETTKKLEDIRAGKLKPLLTSSQKETTKIGGYFPSDQIVLAGRTGTGKTAKMLKDLRDFLDFDLNPHYKDKLIVLYDSWEMAGWRNILRFISQDTQQTVKEILDIQQQMLEEQFERVTAVAQEFKGLPLYISNYSNNVSNWKYNKEQIQGKFPKKIIVNVVDHTRLVTRENEKSEEGLITNLMTTGVYLKNNFSMINYFLTQMNRSIETAVARDKIGTRLPVSSDIFGSDAVFQCADIVLALHRPGMYGLEYFEDIPTGINLQDPDVPDNLLLECILKQREGWTGHLLMEHNLAINSIKDRSQRNSNTLFSNDDTDNNKLPEYSEGY